MSADSKDGNMTDDRNAALAALRAEAEEAERRAAELRERATRAAEEVTAADAEADPEVKADADPEVKAEADPEVKADAEDVTVADADPGAPTDPEAAAEDTAAEDTVPPPRDERNRALDEAPPPRRRFGEVLASTPLLVRVLVVVGLIVAVTASGCWTYVNVQSFLDNRRSLGEGQGTHAEALAQSYDVDTASSSAAEIVTRLFTYTPGTIDGLVADIRDDTVGEFRKNLDELVPRLSAGVKEGNLRQQSTVVARGIQDVRFDQPRDQEIPRNRVTVVLFMTQSVNSDANAGRAQQVQVEAIATVEFVDGRWRLAELATAI